MKKVAIIFFAVLLIGGYLVVANKTRVREVEVTEKAEVLGAENNVKSLAISQQFGSVEITLEPKQLKSSMKTIFSMSVNTHSGDLDYDWAKQAKIKDNLGNEYKVVEWTGESGGHHLGGDLVFEPLDEGVQEVVLTITNVDDTSNNFVWEVE